MTDARERPIIRTALAASALMLLWMGRGLARGEVALASDLLRDNYPFRDFYARSLAANQRFDWMPGLLGGFDFTGSSQNGGYHPVHWLLYRLLPPDTAFGIEMLLPYPLAFAGMWLFLRLWCGPAASAVAAMLFTFSGYCLLRVSLMNYITIVCHLPLLLWCIHHAVAASDWRARARWSAAIAALTGSQLLLDHPQAIWLSGLLEAMYLAYTLTASTVPSRVKAFVTVSGGKLLGVLAGAVQVMATFHAAGHSTRGNFDVEEFAYQHSMPVQHLLQLVNPYVIWGTVLRWSERADAEEYAVYAGAVTLMLVAWWLAGLPARRARGELTSADRFGVWCLPVAVLGLWLAVGRVGGLYTLQTLIPIINEFRVPLRFAVFTYVALTCAAAVGFTQLVRSTRGAPGTTSGSLAVWGLAAVSIVATAIARLYPGTSLPQPDNLAVVTLAPLVFVIAATLITIAARGSKGALLALVFVAAMDQAAYGLAGVTDWQRFATRAQIVSRLAEKAPLPPAGAHRLSSYEFPNVYALAGYQVIEGFVGLIPRGRLDYDSNATLRLAGVEFAHRSSVQKQGSRIKVAEAVSSEWYRLPPPLPRARLVARAQDSRESEKDIETLDIDRVAIVTHSLQLSNEEPGIAAITRDEPGLVDVTTTTPASQLLIVSEMFEDQWTVTIDGAPARVEQVDEDFLGCVVPAGAHNVRFEFHPLYRTVGGPVSLAATGVMALLVAMGWSRPGTAKPGETGTFRPHPGPFERAAALDRS